MLKKIYSLLIIITAALVLVAPASAQILTNVTDPGGLSDMANQVAVTANYSKVSIGVIVSYIIRAILGLLGVIFLALTISAGFRWMTAGGNEETIKKAQGTLTTAIIGLVIVLMAYGITYFIFNKLPFSGGGTMPPAG